MKYVIIYSLDGETDWKRLENSESGPDFLKNVKEMVRVNKMIENFPDYRNYYWEVVELDYFNKYKKPHE